jgi:hypothetical protein
VGHRVVVDMGSVTIYANNLLKDFPKILAMTKEKVTHLYDSFERFQSRGIQSLLSFENDFAEIGVPDVNALSFINLDCRPEWQSKRNSI